METETDDAATAPALTQRDEMRKLTVGIILMGFEEAFAKTNHWIQRGDFYLYLCELTKVEVETGHADANVRAPRGVQNDMRLKIYDIFETMVQLGDVYVIDDDPESVLAELLKSLEAEAAKCV